MHALLAGLVLRRRIIESLPGENSLLDQVLCTVQRGLVIRGGSARLAQIVFRLLNFLRPRAILQLQKLGAGAFRSACCLLVLRAEFLIFQTDKNLAFFDAVAFLHANPSYAACDLGVSLYLVMSHDVAGGGKNDARGGIATVFHGGPGGLDFRSIGREQAIS